MKLTTLKAEVRQWARRSGLADWTITVETKPRITVDRTPAHAVVQCVEDSQRATITFSEESLNSLDKDERQHVIVHELQHIVDDPEDEVLRKALGHGAVYKAWSAVNEKAIDHRAAVLVNAYKRKRDRHSK